MSTPKDLTDYEDEAYRELTHAEAHGLQGLFEKEMNGEAFDPTKKINERFLYKILTERLRRVQEEKFTTAHLRVYLSAVLATTQAEAIQWAWTIRNIYENMHKAHVLQGDQDRAIVGLEDWSFYFAEGVPRQETLQKNWNNQKTKDRANKLDSENIWPIAGNIITNS